MGYFENALDAAPVLLQTLPSVPCNMPRTSRLVGLEFAQALGFVYDGRNLGYVVSSMGCLGVWWHAVLGFLAFQVIQCLPQINMEAHKGPIQRMGSFLRGP